MPSSPTSPLDAQNAPGSVLEVLWAVPDPRKRRGVRHRLPVTLAVGLAAVVAGARSFVAIGDWVAGASDEALSRLGVDPRSRPTESTIRRVFTLLDPAVLDRLVGAFLWARTSVIDGRRVIALDGKTVRGARSRDRAARHLVAAFDHASGTVLGQLATAAKSNEIPCVTTLLALFVLTGVVATLDAMHTQTDTAKAIADGGGHYHDAG